MRATAKTSSLTLAGTALLAATTAALLFYKSGGALKAIAKAQSTGSLSAKVRWLPLDGVSEGLRPFVDAANYFSWVFIALIYGLLIGALIRAALPSSWLARVFNAPGPWGTLWAALLGTPLMLCSCCVAPVFDGAYARTRRLGPSLALMLAAPGLNPADLAVVFLVFPRSIAVARLVLSVCLVAGASAFLGRGQAEAVPVAAAVDEPTPSWPAFGRSLGRALGESLWRSLPAIAIGALCSAAILLWAPIAGLGATGNSALLATLAVATVATFVALPTFGEIPIGIALQLAGAPPSAVVAVLVAGPIINLPSLFVLRRAVSFRLAAAVGLSVLGTALLGGLIAGWLAA